MVVTHLAEDSADLHVLEVGGASHLRDPAGELMPDSEVFGPPSDLLAEFDESAGDATGSDRLFAVMDVAVEVDFHAAGEVVSAIDRGAD
jgi:hypothetical protein